MSLTFADNLGLVGVMTYPDSPDYRPDIDGLTPVQVRMGDLLLSL